MPVLFLEVAAAKEEPARTWPRPHFLAAASRPHGVPCARGGLVRRHVGERYTSTGPPAARWPEPPRPHHRPRQGRRGRWSPHPRLDIRDWSCRGRCAHNPACAGVVEVAGAPPVLGYRDGHEHRARGARNPGRYPHPRLEEGRRRRRGRVARERVRHHPDW